MKTETSTAEEQLASLEQHNSDLQQQVDQLQQQLDWFKRQLFGQKSEKLTPLDHPQQGDLLAGLGSPAAEEPPPVTETVSAHERRKKQRGHSVNDTGLRFDDSVPVQVIEVQVPELQGEYANQYTILRYESTCRLAQRPGSYVILDYRRPVLKHNVKGFVRTTATPPNVLENSVTDVSLLAGLLIDKFLYHLPLYRQHQRLQQAGITVARSSLTNWCSQAIDLLEPVAKAMYAHILQSSLIAMDETPIKAGRQGKGKMQQGYFWPFYGEDQEIYFHYSPSRGSKVVTELLGNTFKGTLLSDGYAAYAEYAKTHQDVTHAQCWAHTRRYFEKAKDADPEAAEQALLIIGALYAEEKKIRQQQLTGKAKLQHRTRYSEPIIKRFWEWCERQCQRHDLTPSHPLVRALKYARARTTPLQVFLSDPEVPLDTNHLESSLRPVAMGRKNWLFCWTELGAKQVGIIQSLLVTCRLHGIDPYTYLVDVLQRVSVHPASQVEQLTPRLWKEHFADNPLRSDMEMGCKTS